MAEAKKVRVYKYKNIAAVLAAVLLICVAVSTHGNVTSASDKTVKNDTSSSVAYKRSDKKSDSTADKSVKKLTGNYKYDELKNGTALNSGRLLLVDSDHLFTGEASDQDGVYGYLFDTAQNQIMYASSTLINGDRQTLESFNKLGVDFSSSTGLKTLMVSQLIPQSDDDSSKYDEAYTGTCIDLMIYDTAAGTFSNFSTEGDYSWIKDNCSKYGFIMRSGSRLRYVGKPYAEYMKNNDLSFEDFLEKVKDYSFESPLFFTADDETNYAVYYTKAALESTTSKVPVPLRDDNTEYHYDISGNNYDGYVVSVDLSDETPVNNTQAADQTESSQQETA